MARTQVSFDSAASGSFTLDGPGVGHPIGFKTIGQVGMLSGGTVSIALRAPQSPPAKVIYFVRVTVKAPASPPVAGPEVKVYETDLWGTPILDLFPYTVTWDFALSD
ncbi:unnamed protein product, partial [marine sediment metagenome]